MAQALLILLINQLDHFGFATINSPQTAGVACSLTVYAYDAGNNIYPYTGPASLFTTPGPQYGNRQINFSIGVWQGQFTAYLADTYSLRCQDYSSPPHTGESNQIIYHSNSAYRLLSILPGQVYAPGIDTGKTGSAISQQAGVEFPVAIYLTDRWCNRISGIADSVVCATSDNFKSSASFRLSDGAGSFYYSFRTAANQRFFSRDVSASGIKSDTSSLLYIYPAAYRRPLVLLPGENHRPGDTASVPSSTPGKSGTTLEQFVDEDFSLTVLAVDSMWNQTATNGNLIHLVSNFPFSDPADQAYISGSCSFLLHYTTIGANQDLYAQDLTASVMSYINRLDIVAKTDSMDIDLDEDTIMAGDTTLIRATLFDRNGDVIAHRPVSFRVIAGHGEIPAFYDTTYTNDQGVGFSYFTCGAGYFDELDTIAVTADDTSFNAVCFIEFPDSMVMEGKIIAYPNPIGIRGDRTRLIYYLQQSCDMTYVIYDPFGNLVHRENIARGAAGARAGVNYLEWNGLNDKGKRVASGIYYIMLKGYVNTAVFLEKRIKVGVIW